MPARGSERRSAGREGGHHRGDVVIVTPLLAPDPKRTFHLFIEMKAIASDYKLPTIIRAASHSMQTALVKARVFIKLKESHHHCNPPKTQPLHHFTDLESSAF